jgi:hypothetical protein
MKNFLGFYLQFLVSAWVRFLFEIQLNPSSFWALSKIQSYFDAENEVLVKENEHLNLTVKAVTTIFNIEEFQVHKISKGKVEANNKEKLT